MSGIDPEYRSRTPGSRPIRARVIVASNRAAAGVYTDTSGPLLAEGLTELGYQGIHEPWDAPWGQRYATVLDPDGNAVDLYCPLPASDS